jgi:hypothetical protein
LWATLWLGSAFGCGGFVGRHFWRNRDGAAVDGRDYIRVARTANAEKRCFGWKPKRLEEGGSGAPALQMQLRLR